MIFEGRSLDDISDKEIADLVGSRVTEQQHLEFKATFEHKDPTARMELLVQCIADPVAASDSANQLVPTADVHSILAPGQQQEYVPLHRTVTQDRAQAGSVTAGC